MVGLGPGTARPLVVSPDPQPPRCSHRTARLAAQPHTAPPAPRHVLTQEPWLPRSLARLSPLWLLPHPPRVARTPGSPGQSARGLEGKQPQAHMALGHLLACQSGMTAPHPGPSQARAWRPQRPHGGPHSSPHREVGGQGLSGSVPPWGRTPGVVLGPGKGALGVRSADQGSWGPANHGRGRRAVADGQIKSLLTAVAKSASGRAGSWGVGDPWGGSSGPPPTEGPGPRTPGRQLGEALPFLSLGPLRLGRARRGGSPGLLLL